MDQQMTCPKHGEVTGRLFASGDLLCPLCINYNQRALSDAETLELVASIHRVERQANPTAAADARRASAQTPLTPR